MKADLRTSAGTLVLDVDEADDHGRAFAARIRSGAYRGRGFDRLVHGFVLQGGGLPEGAADAAMPAFSEGPRVYRKGTIGLAATARPGDTAPTVASQFFICLADLPDLPPDYPVVGRVVGGDDVLARLSAWGTDDSDRPSPPITIDDVAAS